MQLYKCDVCNKIKDCEEIEIQNKVYDICKECKAVMDTTLKGKGRTAPYKVDIQYPIYPVYPIYPLYRGWEPWIYTPTITCGPDIGNDYIAVITYNSAGEVVDEKQSLCFI